MTFKVLDYRSISSSGEYDAFLKDLYTGARQKPHELTIPSVRIISVDGNEPPASEQFQNAIAILYGIGYTLRMGLKYNKLPRPKKYFDYKVGGLEALWWSTTGKLDISDPKTLRWKAYLMVPAFTDHKLFENAVLQAKAKKSEIQYERARLEEMDEGHSVQILHIGPYDKEEPAVALLQNYMKENGLQMVGRHHEIYISDPGRTKPEKLKTVIRFQVKKIKKPE
jgi:hypothetical protein